MSRLRQKKPILLLLSALLALAMFPAIPGYTTQSLSNMVLEHEDGSIDEECTGYIVTGDAGRGQNYFHKNRDSSTWREAVALVIPDDGYKYIAVHTDSHGRSQGYGGAALGGVNEKGVGGATFAGFTDEARPANPWAPSTACRYALQYGGTSEEYVFKFGEIVDQYGISSGGISAAVCPDTAWKIEYAGHQWAAEGPFRDTYEPIGNAFTITSMRQYCTADWSRYGRIRKAREILDRGLYPNAPGKTWFRSWDMQKAFAFARNTEPLECPISGTPVFGTEQLPGSVVGGSDPRPVCDGLPWGRAGRTVSSHLVMPDKQHPDFLSVLWWSLDRPTIAPFIPLYIGITRLPEAIDANADFEAADTFNELRYLVYEHPEYQELVLQIWEKFELRQNRYIRDYLAARVRQLVNTWKEDEASELLNEFLQFQVDEAMDIARKLIVKIETETSAQLLPHYPGLPLAPVPVTGVSVNLQDLTLTAGGDSAVLTATVEPSGATNKKVTWRSNAESIAAVSVNNNSAVVVPVSEGVAIITVTSEDGNFTDHCVVTVLPEDFVTRIHGSNRYTTAVEISRTGWPAGADTVVLARGDDYADALAGIPLAYQLDAPILLTRPDRLIGAVLDEIHRLQATEVIILGGVGAVSESVESILTGLGINVDRIEGANRYETAARIAERLRAEGSSFDTAFMAVGTNFADALSASSYAAMRGEPILLTRSDRLPTATAGALTDLEIINVMVCGGEGSVSSTVTGQLPNHQRYAGLDRYETAAALAEAFLPETTRVCIATGVDFPDAIAGGVLAAKMNTGILLVRGNWSEPNLVVRNFLDQKDIISAALFGGDGAISAGMEDWFRNNLR